MSSTAPQIDPEHQRISSPDALSKSTPSNAAARECHPLPLDSPPGIEDSLLPYRLLRRGRRDPAAVHCCSVVVLLCRGGVLLQRGSVKGSH